MSIGGSVFLIVAGVLVTATLGAKPGSGELRIAGLLLALVGIVALCVALARTRDFDEPRPRRRRPGTGRPRDVAPQPPATRLPRRRPVSGRHAWLLPRRSPAAEPLPQPELPLQSLTIPSLVDQTQVPGQHGKRPPSPRGRWRYPF